MASMWFRSARNLQRMNLQRSMYGARQIQKSAQIMTAADGGPRMTTEASKTPILTTYRTLSSDPSGADAGKSFVENEIKKYPVVIFSYKECQHCKKAKAILNKYKLTPKTYAIHDIDNNKDKTAIVGYLEKKTGSHTLPRVFFQCKFIGGAEDLSRMDESGELGKMMQKVAPRDEASTS